MRQMRAYCAATAPASIAAKTSSKRLPYPGCISLTPRMRRQSAKVAWLAVTTGLPSSASSLATISMVRKPVREMKTASARSLSTYRARR